MNNRLLCFNNLLEPTTRTQARIVGELGSPDGHFPHTCEGVQPFFNLKVVPLLRRILRDHLRTDDDELADSNSTTDLFDIAGQPEHVFLDAQSDDLVPFLTSCKNLIAVNACTYITRKISTKIPTKIRRMSKSRNRSERFDSVVVSEIRTESTNPKWWRRC